jgi:hypothetical protein
MIRNPLPPKSGGSELRFRLIGSYLYGPGSRLMPEAYNASRVPCACMDASLFRSSGEPFGVLPAIPFIFLPFFGFSLRLRAFLLLNVLLMLLSWLLNLTSLLPSLRLLNVLPGLLCWFLNLTSLLLSLRLLNVLPRLLSRLLNTGLSLLLNLWPLLVLLLPLLS